MDITQVQLMYVTTHVIKWCLQYLHYGVCLLFTCRPVSLGSYNIMQYGMYFIFFTFLELTVNFVF
jgi:hypothetical protein